MEISRILESESVFRTNIDWEKEEKGMKKGETSQSKENVI